MNTDCILDAQRAAVLLDPLRLRLLAELREPDSATGLSRKLHMARQRVNYHLRELEKERLIELVEERKKGNCVERIVRATARTYLVNPAALGTLAVDPRQVQDQFSSAYLVAISARAIRDVAVLRERAEKAGKRLATFTLDTQVRFATAADRAAFTEELSVGVARLVAKYHNDEAKDGRRFQFFVGAYPKIPERRRGDESEGSRIGHAGDS